jgi:hypothetical protein
LSTTILVAGSASTSLEKLKVTFGLKVYETAFLSVDFSVENSNPVIGQTLFLLLETS